MIKKAFPILAFSIFSSLLGSGIIIPLLPLYAENMGASGIWLGMIFAGFSISRVIFMPIASRLADRSGQKLILSIGLITYAIISLGFIWADTVVELTIIRLLQGISAGMVIPIAQAYIGDISPRAEEGKWMGYFNAAFLTGFGIGPLMGGILAEQFGIDAPFYSMSGLNFLAFLGVALFLPATEQKKTMKSTTSLKRIFTSSSNIRGITSFHLVLSMGRGSFATFLPVFAAAYIGLSPSLIGIILTVNILTMSLLQPYGGNIADRLNRRNLIVLGSVMNLTYLALIPFTNNFWQLLAVCILGGLGGAASIPAATAMTVEEGRKYGMNSTMTIFAMAFSAGMATGPLLAGTIADSINTISVFYFAAAVGLLGTGSVLWFTRSYHPNLIPAKDKPKISL